MPACDPSPQAIEGQLARILSDETLRRSPSLSRLLKYLVSKGLAGEELKEYTIGVEVFDRPEAFDPRDDTIVRVQVRNLRKRLEEYFAVPRAEDTVRLSIPKGYTLVFESLSAAPPAPPMRRYSKRSALLAGLLGLLTVAIIVGLTLPKRSSASAGYAVPVLLVTPLANLSADKDNEYFADGLTDELMDSVANIPHLRVLTRSAARRWKDKQIDPNFLKDSGITHVLEGSVRKEGSNVRIAVRLIEARKGENLWSRSFDREIQDSLAAEREIATAVAASLRIKLDPGVAFTVNRTPNADAYDLYLKGRYYWRLYDAAAAAKGIAYLERSLSIDPDFAPAYVALAGCYGTQGIFYAIPSTEAFKKLRHAAERALELDDSLAEAHTLLAGTYAFLDWNWPRAEIEFRRAIALAPQAVISHQYFGSFLGPLGRLDEAEEEIKEAARLDAQETFVKWAQAQIYYWRGNYRQAEDVLLQVENQDPNFALTAQLSSKVYWAEGKWKEAEAALRKRVDKQPADFLCIGQLGYTLAKMGRIEESKALLRGLADRERQGIVPQHAFAFVYLGLDDSGHAIESLVRAADRHEIRPPWLTIDPYYEPLRRESRFRDLLVRTNLAK